MIIGIPKETADKETRVAVSPAVIQTYLRNKHQIIVESGAGTAASFSDEAYKNAGAEIVPDAKSVYAASSIILKVQPPGQEDAQLIKENGVYIGYLAPFTNAEAIRIFAERKITSYAMELVPRITRAQNMDALSAMANIGGYKSVLIAADHMPKMFPMMMTAAGTIPPAVVLILGVGVAGLQAIATAKRLGARVEAFDPRPAVKEQIKSLGATFVEMEITEDAETKGGYAKQMSEEFLLKEREVIGARFPKVDVVICTAQVFGKRAPVLVTEEMVRMLRPGSIIVDLAAEQGGNCELTQPDQTIVVHGVTIIGAINLPARLPVDSSQMYSKILSNLFHLLYPKPESQPDFNDEIIAGCCVTRDGAVVNAQVKSALGL